MQSQAVAETLSETVQKDLRRELDQAALDSNGLPCRGRAVNGALDEVLYEEEFRAGKNNAGFGSHPGPGRDQAQKFNEGIAPLYSLVKSTQPNFRVQPN